jgi:hypothetical protein
MKTRIEKVNEIFRKKQAFENSFKKKIKSIKSDQKEEELQKYNDTLNQFIESYALIKGTYMNSDAYIGKIENEINSLYSEFNTYKLNVLYDFEEMNKEIFDNYEKKIEELKQKKDKLIIKNKKYHLDINSSIEKINIEIKERLSDYNDSSKEERKQLYTEIIERKKNIFEIKQKFCSIIPVYDESFIYSTLVINYNPIHEINVSNLEINIGKEQNLDIEEIE